MINTGSFCDHKETFRIDHLDSLGMHDSRKIMGVVMEWLESEYKRIFPDSLPAKKKKYYDTILLPAIPLQNNAWDCGVFVYRYANEFFLERNNMMSSKDLKKMYLKK